METEHTDLTVDVATSLESKDFQDFWGWGRRYARRLLTNEFDSEDVVQEAFVRLVTKYQRGEWNPPRGELAAIFAKIIRNLCIDKLRRNSSQTNANEECWIGAAPSAESCAIAKETRQQIEIALAKLPDRWREALLLRASGLNYEEISEAMNCTKAQIRTWIFRARQQLISQLKLEDAL